MGNIIISNDIITVANAAITVQGTASGFAKVDMMDLWHLKRRWRMDSANKSDTNPIVRIDLSAAKTLDSIMLNDINFDKVIIKGHASDLGTDWTAASFSSGALSVSCDAQVNRYKIYAALTSFNYQYLAIIVPTAASAVGSYTSAWEIGTVVSLDSINTFTKNMGYGYQRGATRAYKEIKLASGHVERFDVGDMRWQGTLSFKVRSTSHESDLTTMNNLNIADPLVFYENNSDTSKVYLCLRNDNYIGTISHYGLVDGVTIRLEELV